MDARACTLATWRNASREEDEGKWNELLRRAICALTLFPLVQPSFETATIPFPPIEIKDCSVLAVAVERELLRRIDIVTGILEFDRLIDDRGKERWIIGMVVSRLLMFTKFCFFAKIILKKWHLLYPKIENFTRQSIMSIMFLIHITNIVCV